MTTPDGPRAQASVWARTHRATQELRDRLERVLGRPVTLTEAWDRAVTGWSSASDEDLRKGEL